MPHCWKSHVVAHIDPIDGLIIFAGNNHKHTQSQKPEVIILPADATNLNTLQWEVDNVSADDVSHPILGQKIF